MYLIAAVVVRTTKLINWFVSFLLDLKAIHLSYYMLPGLGVYCKKTVPNSESWSVSKLYYNYPPFCFALLSSIFPMFLIKFIRSPVWKHNLTQLPRLALGTKLDLNSCHEISWKRIRRLKRRGNYFSQQSAAGKLCQIVKRQPEISKRYWSHHVNMVILKLN